MIKSVVILLSSMVGWASAFAPSSTQSPASAVVVQAERKWNSMVDKTERSKACPWLPRPINLDGTLAGDQGFDPFYLSSIDLDFAGFIQPPSWEATKGIATLYWMRESELKHGRTAMLAVVGWIATDFGLRFPLEPFKSIPSSYNAHDILVNQGAMAVMLIAIGLVECTTGAVLVDVSKGESDRDAGDFKFDGGYLKGKTPEQIKDLETKEINNGRLAMLAFGGISTQTALDASFHDFPYF